MIMLKFSFKGGWHAGNYLGTYYIFTYPSSKHNNQLIPSNDLNTCREYFVRRYRSMIDYYGTYEDRIKKAYAIVSCGSPQNGDFGLFNTSLLAEAQKSLYIVNSFEKKHKWPLTKLYPVECTNSEIPMVFFVGPRKWTMSPYLMSIWTLCIRLGRNNWLPKGLLTFNHRNLVRQLAVNANTFSGFDAYQLRLTIKEWDTFMGLYHKLFGGIERKNHWSKTHLNGRDDIPEGIARLIGGGTAYKELHNKFTELTKKEPK